MRNNIKKIREMKGLSQAALAKKIGTYSQQIYRLETKDDSLELKWLDLIAKALGVSVLDLIFDEEEQMSFNNSSIYNSTITNSGNNTTRIGEFEIEIFNLINKLNTKNKAHIVLEIHTLLESQKFDG